MSFADHVPAGKLSRLLDEATDALARLDEERLEQLGARALELEALRVVDGVTAEEVAARLRVFASVLRATGCSLAVLTRVCPGAYSSRPQTEHAPYGPSRVSDTSLRHRQDWGRGHGRGNPRIAAHAMKG